MIGGPVYTTGASKIAVGDELNNTPVAGANDTVAGTTNRYYTFHTLPTTSSFYVLTGIEWLNGTVVNGSIMCHIDLVDANPPVANASVLIAHTIQAAQTGASAVQRNNSIVAPIIPGGTLLGISIVSNSATGRIGTTTVGAANRLRAIAFTQGTLNGSSVSWASGTEEPYLKLYYKAVNLL